MKTLNTIYRDAQKLQEFISENTIYKHKDKTILVQVFSGVCDIKYIQEIIAQIKVQLPDAKIIGSTTEGEIIDDIVLHRNAIVSFTIFENTEVVTYCCENIDSDLKKAEEFISKFDKTKKPKVAIAFADGLYTNGEYLMNVFRQYDPELIVAGGLAGDNAEFINTIVFTQDEILTNGVVVAMLYNDDLIVNTQANFGWENIGKVLHITKAQDNVVYEIDGIKAVDIYEKYLGDQISKKLPRTGIEFPLIIKKEGFNIARAVVGKNDDSSLVFAGNLSVGDEVTFGYGNIETIINNGEGVYKNLICKPVEGIFIYSCMARKALLGKNIEMELKPLKDIAPLSGFFTYGEFYRSDDTNQMELLNQTMTILTLSESRETNSVYNSLKFKEFGEKNSTLSALSHLISQTTKELEDINNSLENKVKEEVEKNRQKDNQMLQQSRLAQMGEMISMIAHQWRQPLTAISATAISMRIKIELERIDRDDIMSSITKIYDYVQHLSATIDDFRDFFRPEKNRVEVDYCEIINGVLNIVEIPIKNQNIRLVKELDCKSRFFVYDNELKQVVLNIVKNAEDALLEKMVEDPYIKLKTFNEANSYVLEISDNAGGIPQDIMDKIFDPYFSTKSKKDGTGLGLYMSKIIIHEHCDGRLSVRNGNDGAIFRIELIKN